MDHQEGPLKWRGYGPSLPGSDRHITASGQKIFSADPKVGYWKQHSQYVAAKEAGETSFGAAKNAVQIDAVIRNTFIQGTLSIVFAVLVLIVVAAGVVIVLRSLRGTGIPLAEDEPVPSRIFAPSGLIATEAEKGGAEGMGHAGTLARQIPGTGAH